MAPEELGDKMKVPPDQARSELHDLMCALSEKAVCAQWYGGLEFILWDRIGRGASRFGQLELSEPLLGQLAELSQRAEGWFFYSDEAEEQTGDPIEFVDFNTWETMYKEWLQRTPEENRPRDR